MVGTHIHKMSCQRDRVFKLNLSNISHSHCETEIRTSISSSSAVELNTTSALANYATEAGVDKRPVVVPSLNELVGNTPASEMTVKRPLVYLAFLMVIEPGALGSVDNTRYGPSSGEMEGTSIKVVAIKSCFFTRIVHFTCVLLVKPRAEYLALDLTCFSSNTSATTAECFAVNTHLTIPASVTLTSHDTSLGNTHISRYQPL
uniref:Uncharacterized protein n=1 Tax=Timema monikensis TaxID=170555 RepID=A0A7R9EBD3_9NEOP|nr:unnamed protein product [Timema monikensis]